MMMKLDTFITEALIDIENGLISATAKTGKKYRVIDERDAKGLDFDIAVTTINTDSTGASGAVKAGIQVFGLDLGSAGGSLNSEKKSEQSEVSRLKFSIHIPEQTSAELQNTIAQIPDDTRNFSIGSNTSRTNNRYSR